MINKLFLKNFRAFEEVDLDFSKINIFLGPNNSGKSSLLSSINLLSQTVQSPDTSVKLLLNGNYEELGTYRDVVFNNEENRNIIIGIGGVFEDMRKIKKSHSDGFFQVEYKFRPRRHEIVIQRTMTQSPIGNNGLITKRTLKGKQLFELYDINGKNVFQEKARTKIAFYHYLPLFGYYKKMPKDNLQLIRSYVDYLFNFMNSIRDVEYVGPFREFPKRTYLYSGENPKSVGIKGEKAIDMLVMDSLKRGKNKRGIIDSVANWLQQSEIASNIEINALTERHYEIRLSQFTTGENENLADIGFGCSQILPILIAGFNLSDRGIFIVQQPEIHLHPKAQAELGSFFNGLAEKGVQSFIETHSEHLILRIQRHIANGDLNSGDVRIYYVYPNKQTKNKDIVKIELDDNGRFRSEWPEGFFPERLHEVKAIFNPS